MAQPTAGDVHVDVPLSQIAIAYKNQEYIGEGIFPSIPVMKQSDKYYIWTKEFWFRNQVELRAPGDTYPEGGLGITTGNYAADIFHLSHPIPDEVRKNQDPAVQLEVSAAEWLADQFMLNRESKISTDVFKTSVWDTDKLLTGTAQWSDFENSDPINDVDVGLTKVQGNTGVDPNVLVVGREVFDKLKRHPLLLEIFKHTGRGILTIGMVQDALNVPKILVGKGIETTTAEGAATITYTRLWGKSGLLLYTPPNPGLRVPAAGYTLVWAIDGDGLNVHITNFRDSARDRDLIRGKHAFDDKITGTDLGYFFDTAVA